MQPLPKFEYREPESVAEAARLLAEFGSRAKLIGGGTDLVPSMRQGLFAPACVISLQRIAGLRGIAWEEGAGLRIGALTTLREVEASTEARARFPFLAAAAREVGSPQLREMGTVGGNLCLDTRCRYYNQSEDWQDCVEACVKRGGEFCKASPNGRARKCFAVFSADLATALVAAGARVTLQSAGGARTIDLADYYTGDGASPHAAKPGEVLTEVLVPGRMQGVFGTYLKYRVRQAIDYPIAGVALTLRARDGRVHDARMIVGGVASRPLVVKAVPELLEGRVLDEPLVESAARLARKAATPLANTAGDRAHRRQMVYEFARRALAQAAAHAAVATGEKGAR
ncbi:MAG: FAD binding domain-containing protein [Burkholderiales bacterium]|nr:FAD binding domain-containing protein [Burkholderiales bacterium]